MSNEKKSKLVEKFLKVLKDEREVDIEETYTLLSTLPPKKLAAKGLACVNLVISSMRTGLGGKTIIDLEPDNSISMTDKISSGEIRVGDIVKVEPQPSESGLKKPSSKLKKQTQKDTTANDQASESTAEGVIVKVTARSISVAIDDQSEAKIALLNGRLWVAKLVNSSTYKRMEYALNDLDKSESLSRLVQTLLGDAPATVKQEPLSTLKILDESLNPPQRDAVSFALGSDISVIHGPPGTGKTYTLIEIIRQLVSKGERVLVCGPSNISVDNILERLHPHMKGDQLIRLGHPARLLQANLIHSLDIISKNCNQGMVIQDIRQEIDQNLGKISKTRSGRERKEIYNEIKQLRKDFRVREKQVISDLVLSAKVVVSTLHGAGSYAIKDAAAKNPGGKPLFNTIIIDEVSQALEPQCWIPVMMCPTAQRLIIAGDNMQLPPTIKSKGKTQQVLEQTIFDRLLKVHGEKIKHMLTIQYRMNKQIMEFPSKALYKSKLEADSSVAERLLQDLPGVKPCDDTQTPVIWLDTQGDDFPERQEDETSDSIRGSRYNENEAALVVQYIKRLLESDCQPSDIGVISPYSAQVGLLKQLISNDYPDIEISTVDGFQGREKEIIIITLVRSNSEHEVGFLAEKRRTNVAITRPRRHLCIIGNSETLLRSKVEFLKSWVDWAEDKAAIEYPDVSDVL